MTDSTNQTKPKVVTILQDDGLPPGLADVLIQRQDQIYERLVRIETRIVTLLKTLGYTAYGEAPGAEDAPVASDT